jgi:hypothetical protein
MSEPIQSIAQNNYILHNIDAKKLYVQEPLFTANSGDAVYVGWRPDETVLYSGTVGTSAVTLSESFKNFESIKLVHNTQVEEFWKPNAGDAVRYWHNYGTMAQGVYKMAMVQVSMPDTTHITNVSSKSLNFPLTGTSFTASVVVNDTYALNTIREVIGINRISGGNA